MVTKVGILTFQNTLNYGATLQCYALYHTLQTLGFEPVVIDYRCKSITAFEMPPKITNCRTLKSVITWPYKYFVRSRKQTLFRNSDDKYITLLPVSNNLNIIEQCSELDAIIVGSDQVWNPYLTDNDMQYFLPGNAVHTKKLSYAASFGKATFPSDCKQVASRYLSKFDRISVREKQGLDIVSEMTGKTAVQVVDPTLLLSTDEWRSFATDVMPQKRYILAYAVNMQDEVVSKAKALSSQIGLPIVFIHSYSTKPVRGVHNILYCSPQDFVGYFKNAECVVTSSFHGVCFSVLMRRNLVPVLDIRKDNTNSRITNLLEMCGLSDRINSTNIGNIDYDSVEKALEPQRKASVDFIKHSLTD